jgi:hypothetical protein
MGFGLVFRDDTGVVWTVDVQSADAQRGRSLVFSRPTFLEPSEQRALDGIPACWPNCSDEELRQFLEAATLRTSG